MPYDVFGFNEYQRMASATNLYPADKMLHCLVFGVTSEAGEIADKMKKYYRDAGNGIADYEDLKRGILVELGDVLWYLSQIASFLQVSLKDVAEYNIMKLEDRAQRGVINGSGDDR
jgi:NTP pyrophosphatase (non-canonical NTP hydrolase)